MATRVSAVRFEHRVDALGIGTGTPRLSWQVETDDPNWRQSAYEVELDGMTVTRVDSADQVLVPWPFAPLASRAQASVRVRVAAGQGWSDWSDPATAEAGLLRTADWSARFISPSLVGAMGGPAPILSRRIALRPGISSARLYATAHGSYEARVNGSRVGDEVLAPGWTSYAHRLRYQTYDVTQLLRSGENWLEFLLGNGWYRGGPSRVWRSEDADPAYGSRLALLAQLEVNYDDGSVQVLGTDDTWMAAESGVLADDLYQGQCTDLRPRRADAPLSAVEVVNHDLGRLVAAVSPPVRVIKVVPAVKVFASSSGKHLVDFGQNLVGWVRLRVSAGSAATGEIVVRHAEVLEDGELSVGPLRGARATDTYLVDPSAEATLEPSFTFHGFRYAEIAGVADLGAADVDAVVIGSDLRRIGWFSCSDPDLERLHENVVWSARGNFLHVPTDCPQRAERLGWTGDIQVFAPTASFLFDVAGFLDSWLADLAVEQHDDGTVPHVVPNSLTRTQLPAAGWGDAATVVPWVLHQRYADAGLLARQFDSMRAWVDKLVSLTTDGVWAGGFQFGDWVDPTAPPDDPFAAKADHDVVATAYLARSAEIVADAARVLGRDAERERYAALAEVTRRAFVREYVTSSGRIISDAQTVYALAIAWNLLPTERQRQQATERLADLVRANGFRIGTGFLGTPVMADALTSGGRVDLAFRLLLERACPSWLYPVTMGATTIWERWDSIRPDGTVNPGRMVSFNHYALGAVADWLHRTVAGLAPGAPGYRHIVVRPVPHPALTHAKARHLTPYGEASVAWRRDGGLLTVDVVVPAGTEATVHLPGAAADEVRHGRHTWTVADPCAAPARSVSTVRDLIDSHLWPRAVSMLVEYGLCADGVGLAEAAERYLDQPAIELPEILVCMEPNGAAVGARRALQRLLETGPSGAPDDVTAGTSITAAGAQVSAAS